MTPKPFSGEELAVIQSGILHIWDFLPDWQKQNWQALAEIINERMAEASVKDHT